MKCKFFQTLIIVLNILILGMPTEISFSENDAGFLPKSLFAIVTFVISHFRSFELSATSFVFDYTLNVTLA